MQASHFNLFYENFSDSGKTLVFNTRTQAVLLIEDSLAKKLKSRKGFRVCFEDEIEKMLIEHGIGFEDQEDELELLTEWMHQKSFDQRKLKITILTTYVCNFSCDYCFEKEIQSQSSQMLSLSHADQICKWIMNKALQKKSPEINVLFYGGEPLLNKKAIDFIAEKMFVFCREQNILFSFGFVTNGYFITRNDSLRWLEWGLLFYRVTLDGDEKSHDESRILKNGRPTFQRIIDNLMDVPEDVQIMIAGNYTMKNAHAMVDLIGFLKKHSLGARIHSLDFAPVMEIESNACTQCSCTGNRDKEVERMTEIIHKAMTENGFRHAREDIAMQMCPFKVNDTEVVFSPDGSIYKCPITVGDKRFKMGEMSSMEMNERSDEILASETWKECFPCEYLPVCGGACYYNNQTANGDMFKFKCPKKFYQKFFPDRMRSNFSDMVKHTKGD